MSGWSAPQTGSAPGTDDFATDVNYAWNPDFDALEHFNEFGNEANLLNGVGLGFNNESDFGNFYAYNFGPTPDQQPVWGAVVPAGLTVTLGDNAGLMTNPDSPGTATTVSSPGPGEAPTRLLLRRRLPRPRYVIGLFNIQISHLVVDARQIC